MYQSITSTNDRLIQIVLLISISTFLVHLSRSDAAAAAAAPAAAAAAPYTNYTVGDSLGWYDRLENTKVDYQNWVGGKNFSLGDFLIFNTDTNHSVIQTYNPKTYKLCDYADASDHDTTQWSSADPSATNPQPASVAVPLLKVGMVYFFSGDYDGEQCKNGQHFAINVRYGNGLPPSLQSSPPDRAPAPVNPADSGSGGDSIPDTLVPSNFDNPQNVSDDGSVPSKTGITATFPGFFLVTFYGILILVGLYSTV